jgi:hypothetical protein
VRVGLQLCERGEEIDELIDESVDRKEDRFVIAREKLLEFHANRHTHSDFADYGPSRSDF